MAQNYGPRITQDGLVMCLDASNNKSYPTDLPVKNGLVMWMDAADDTTFSYSSGTTVSQWRDKSGFNYHMVPVTAGPTRNAFLNSRKVIACTTTQQIWNSSINLSTSVYTIFCVTRLSGTTPSRVLSTQYSAAAGGNWLLGHWGGHYNQYYAEGWVQYQGYPADNTWRMYMGDWSGSSTDLANLYSNGTAIATNSNGANAGPIGLGINISNEVSTCEAAEIIVFNRILSDTERKQVHTYLGQKWGISNTDRSIIDLSGNGINPEMSNTIFSPDNRGVINFNGKAIGTNAVSVIKTTTSIIDRNDGQEITVSCWIKPLRTSGQYSIIATNRSNNDATYNWIFYQHTTDGAISFHGDNQNKSTYVPVINQWINVVNTVTAGGVSTLYVNGVSTFVVTGYTYGNGTPSRLGIGANPSSAESFQGSIAQTLIYNRALSATEIVQNYEALKSKFANTIVESGLVLNLDAGNPYSYAGAGTTWYDVSGNSFNATLINSPTYISDNGGVLNWASANSQYATVPMSSTLRVASITQEVWVYLSSTADQVFIGSQYGTSSNNSFALWIQSGTFYFGVNVGGTFYTSTSSAASTSTWYHLVHTYNGTTQYLYINGVLTTTFNSAASGNISYDTSNTLLAIGADFNGTGYNVGPSVYTNGKMPVVRIYNIALSAAQVLQNYNATKGRFGL